MRIFVFKPITTLMIRFVIVVFFFFATGICLAQKNKKEKNVKFEENLDALRPEYKYVRQLFQGVSRVIEINKNSENSSLPDSLLRFRYDITSKLNKIMDYVPVGVVVKIRKPGFRVQVYSGKDREEASRIKGMSLNVQKEEEAYLVFDRPNYRVKVGDFLTREDARELYKLMKRRFSETVIVPDQVMVIKKASPDEMILLQQQETRNRKNR